MMEVIVVIVGWVKHSETHPFLFFPSGVVGSVSLHPPYIYFLEELMGEVEKA